jgi:hypothetical protein
MRGRRSTLMGAMVQATNMAIHHTIERKPARNRAVYNADQQLAEQNEREEVIISRK